MRRFVDLSEMPLRPESASHDVSTGKIVVKCIMFGGKDPIEVSYGPKAKAMLGVVQTYPYCVLHGAMVKNSPAGIWRCQGCPEGHHVGCWEIPERLVEQKPAL